MRVAIGGDHHGLAFKQMLAELLRERGHEVVDLGAHTTDPVDYPDYAAAVGRAVSGGQADRGIIICGSGVGASIAANKLRGVRAAICHDTYSAGQGVEHDDMNVLCLGSRVVGPEVAKELALAFVGASFDPTDRYVRRLRKVEALEESGG